MLLQGRQRTSSGVNAVRGHPSRSLTSRTDKAATRVQLEKAGRSLSRVVSFSRQFSIVANGKEGQGIVAAIGPVEKLTVGVIFISAVVLSSRSNPSGKVEIT